MVTMFLKGILPEYGVFKLDFCGGEILDFMVLS